MQALRTLAKSAQVLAAAVLLPLRSPAAEDRHWTTNGVHRGILAASRRLAYYDDRDRIGSYQLSYALWMLAGEPMQDFSFVWKWPEEPEWSRVRVGSATVDRQTVLVTVADLKRHPDLLQRFRTLKPISVELNLSIELLIAEEGSRSPTESRGTKTVKPDLIGQSGQKLDSIVPGSPDWADYFQLFGLNYERAERARRNKDLFRRAQLVRLVFSHPDLKSVEWPDGTLQAILKGYGERESKPLRRTNEIARATNAPVATAARTNQPPRKLGPNPLDPHPALRPGENPLDPHPQRAATGGNPLSPGSTEPGNPIERTFQPKNRSWFWAVRGQAARSAAPLWLPGGDN
jgi:hypothetical protein